ncbi:MAG: hypothetical protein AB7Q97_01925 [Gammaproteobacteria bacterium]
MDQLPLIVTTARDRGHAAAKRAGDSAGAIWQATAIGAIRLYCQKHAGPFLIEDVRAAIERGEIVNVPPAPDQRAWGHAALAARRLGIIRAVGYAPAASSNGSAKVRWARA